VTSAAKYRKPLTGEKRKSRMPLRIDKLSAEVKRTIIDARAAGETWKETAAMASAASGLHLAPSVVQRWYDLRIEQPASESGFPVHLLHKIVALLELILAEVRS
jgi:hypothetical protein